MPDPWGDWAEVRLLVKTLIEKQDKRIDEICDNIKWLVRAVLLALLGITANAILNFIQLKGG